ncbi:MAG: hypothetical protein KatS3mg083_268 [Candidatus Dojkabacteria bacterium]|nr:MAG: hypothetical protein KatS3mg083_268 [Candidatus Dojkabacteria bacterium]
MNKAEFYQKVFYWTLGNLFYEIFNSIYESGTTLERDRIIKIIYDELPLSDDVDYEIDIYPIATEKEYEEVAREVPFWFEPYNEMVIMITEKWKDTGETNHMPFVVPNVCEEFISVE